MAGWVVRVNIGLFGKFNIWPPDLVFVMDNWTLHKPLTAIYVCVHLCMHYPRDMLVSVCVGVWVLE